MIMYTLRRYVSVGCMIIYCCKSTSIFVATYAAHFWQCSQFAFDTQSRKRNISLAALWCKLLMVRVLHVMREDLHINTVEAVNEDWLKTRCQNIFVCSGERGCLSHRGKCQAGSTDPYLVILSIDLLM